MFDDDNDDDLISENDPGIRSSVILLTKDLVDAATDLSIDEVRFLVDSYYIIQKDRIRSKAQVKALAKSGEPHKVIGWLAEQSRVLEYQIKRTLAKFSEHHAYGDWPLSVTGIGPVITAGLISHIDMGKAPTAGHIMSFAGLNPTKLWLKGQKRPWNADLKTLCWKIGESFVKMQNRESDVYGHLFVIRKDEEWTRNLNGEFSDQAAKVLEDKNIGKDTMAYAFYSGQFSPVQIHNYLRNNEPIPEGLKPDGTTPTLRMLPPAHVHARARRWVVKIFISNLHEVWFELYYDKPAPEPYPFAHLGHTHKINPLKKKK